MYIFSNKGHEEECPVCKFRLSDFIAHQRIGCSFCYIFLRKGLKNLISAVQDENNLHKGKKPEVSPHLLLQFFNYVIDLEIENGDSDVDDCRELKNLLSRQF